MQLEHVPFESEKDEAKAFAVWCRYGENPVPFCGFALENPGFTRQICPAISSFVTILKIVVAVVFSLYLVQEW